MHMLYKMSIGGAETFVSNFLSVVDNQKYQIDICIQGKDVTNKRLYTLCKKKGCHIYVIPAFNRNYLAYMLAVRKLLRNRTYDVVHIHMNALINCAPIYIAMRYAKRVVVHSHSTKNNMGGKVGLLIHYVNRWMLRNKNIIRVACGTESGNWMFGECPFTVLDNAVSIPEFVYNEKKREVIRTELGIKDKKVIGHVGRFVEVKNHEFLLDVFSEYIKKEKKNMLCKNTGIYSSSEKEKQKIDTVLVLVGDGELLASMKQKVHDLAIEKYVIFVGGKTEVAPYYSAFDCLLFPSKFEGLPFVLIEAQVNGLPIIASDRVTTEMDLTGNIKFLPLDTPIQEWISAIEKALEPVDRLSFVKKIERTKYNVKNMAEKLESIYSS